jgi:hypothetical protein
MMSDVRTWAREYRDRGFAVCRIRPGQKRPTYKSWNQYSLEPDQFRQKDNIGLQAGALSGNLVCVDLDHADVLDKADRYLPETGMVEGRGGKPRSHRWFLVKDVPPELAAPDHVAGGLGGPRTRRLKRPDGVTLVEFLGTGAQAVVPASLWVSRDGTRSEKRQWHKLAEPAVVDCRELFEATCRLAAAAGWVTRECSRPGKGRVSREAPGPLPMPTGKIVQQARKYLAKMDPAIEGQGGDRQTYQAAYVLVLGFGLPPEEALPLLVEYNRRCDPPWTLEELRHKLQMADAQEGKRRWLVRKGARRVTVQLGPAEEPVYVGVDCAGQELSFIDLSPSLYAGMFKIGTTWELTSELSEIPWEGKKVILTPTSTVTTNARETWGEYFLARLLRKYGAEVKAIRLPPIEGRRRTFSMADDLGWEVVDPPLHPWDAAAAADLAREQARRLDPLRRALPRKKPSTQLEKAIAFVQKHGVRRLGKDIVKRAKRKGVTRATLRRAIQSVREG